MRVFLPDLAPFRDLTLEGVTPVYYSRDALPEGGADGFVLWFLPEAQRRDLLSRPGLKWVLTLTAGIDHVVNDLPDGVQLFNAHALHDRAVAQHALALVLAAGRGLHRFRDAQHARRWERAGAMYTLEGRHVVVWGFGHIGRLLEGMLLPLGATVAGLTSRSTPDDVNAALASADDLVLLLPRTPATRHILNADRLARLPRHAWVYNLGRGELIDPDALLHALQDDALGGAALDVTAPEPLPQSSPLWTQPNVIVTPHVGSTTDDLIRRGAAYTARFVEAVRTGVDVPDPVQTDRGY
ncbi:NAD(P)-dependent oxidoreductase [Deinococcus aquiradiocola]|uniref:2-hydroxyacid dehydrogenase n=1 Tax=Deinococcus aquiradiocola TaxID=393059 RepID=A0A917P4K1_9DEIO|nr:NAD(P)-dependent oxidoreductase [Deinococcus aquiradiocola]GGJ61405.1 2-hydroxyacid dehydrogenase [Deinococcus aquiradiocola]